MTPRPATIAMVAALALWAAAGAARAGQGGTLILAANDFAAPSYGVDASMPRRTLEWDASKGRWGLNLGVEQHIDRDAQWKDLSPGVYYRLSRRLHIGGAVSLAPDQVDTSRLLKPLPPTPRVRLETTFKF